MKYGKLSHGNVDVDQKKTIHVADGDASDRPDDPKTGDIRYNHDREAVGIGDNSGFGQYEIFQNGEWNTLMTEMDFTDARDLKNKETVSDNVIFKLIANSLKETFVTAIGSISLVQESNNFDPPYTGMFNGFHLGRRNAGDATRRAYHPGVQTEYDQWNPTNMEDFAGEDRLPVYLTNMQLTGNGTAADMGFPQFGAPNNANMIESTDSGNNLVGAFKAFIGRGRIYDVVVDNPGAGYSHDEPPQLLIDTRGGSGAVLMASMTAGIITQVTVLESGAGYRDDKILIYEKGARARTFATFQINTSDDGSGTGTKKIDSVTVLSGGQGYESVPEVYISDGGHSAIIEPIMSPDSGGEGKIEDVKIMSSGWDFSVTPDVVIKTNKMPTTPAQLSCVIGEDQILAIKLMKPIVSNYFENGRIPLIISGGNPDIPAQADLVVQNGVGVFVDLTNTGKNYDSEPTITLPNWFREPTTDVTVFGGNIANQFLNFDFNIFQACGVPVAERAKYDISLLTNLNGTIPMLNPYQNATVRMMVQFVPQWEPFNNFNHAEYGNYQCNIELYGQRFYYASAVSAAWRAEVTKART